VAEAGTIPARIDSARRRLAAAPPTEARDRVRRLPGLRQTASWQAAYNTACLYAALISTRRANSENPSGQEEAGWEDRVVLSLERVAANPYAEMRRPYDVIAKDPDFGALRAAPETFRVFAKFLLDQRRTDYPDVAPAGRPALTSVEPA